MKELNIKPARIEFPQDFAEKQRARLLAIPVAENARRTRSRMLFFVTSAAACILLIAGLAVPGLFAGPGIQDDLDGYYSQLSDSSLQQAVDMADLDPFFDCQ